MRTLKSIALLLLAGVVMLAIHACDPVDNGPKPVVVEEPDETITHEGFVYEPMSSDRIIWHRSLDKVDSLGEEWVHGIGAQPVASWKGCPCCPVAMDSGGCCLPCLAYGASRYEGSEKPKAMANDPVVLITIEHRFPVPGTVFATAACLITRDPQSTDPLEMRFGLTMDGSPEKKMEDGGSEVSRQIPPDSVGEGQWIQFRQEFHVESAATSFSLTGEAPAGSSGDLVGPRIINLTFLPDLN